MKFSRIILASVVCVILSVYTSLGATKAEFSTALEKAKRGDAEAQFKVGRMYEKGLGVKQDYNKAREYYEKAAAQNVGLAFVNLGYTYEKGLGVKQDYNKACEYYEKAAAQNVGLAFVNLGYTYEKGLGVKQDYNKAREYYEKAAAQNVGMAFNNLGYMYEQGHGVKQDYNKAREYYEKAAAQNVGMAFNNLGYLYTDGLGVKRDYNKAREYYEKAAAQNVGLAFKNLGDMYENGRGVKASYQEAHKYYTKGAELANAYCMMSLGRFHENGLGVRSNLKKAIDYYQHAAAGGNVQAAKALARLNVDKKAPSQKQPVKPSTNNLDATLSNADATIKPRVAIYKFVDKSEEGNAPAASILDIMTTELHNSGVFTVIEREYLNRIIDEVKFGQIALFDPSQASKPGRIAGAQYAILGAITLCYYSEKASGSVFPILGSSTKAKTAYVVLDIRIVDVETSEILYASAQTGEATQTANTSLGNHRKIVGGLLSLAIHDSVMKHVSAIKAKTWES